MVAIHCAAARGDIGEVRKLIQDGADINRHGDDQYRDKTALVFAAENGHADIVELLLNQGAQFDKDLLSHHDFSILRHGNTDVIDLLLRRGAKVNYTVSGDYPWSSSKDGLTLFYPRNRQTVLLDIDYTKDTARLLVEMLLVAGADVRTTLGYRYDKSHRHTRTALDMARTPSVRALLYAAGCRPDTTKYSKEPTGVPQCILDDMFEPMLPLKGLCRRRIRRHLLSPAGGNHLINNLIMAVPRLPLPRQLKEFLLFGEECTYRQDGQSGGELGGQQSKFEKFCILI